MNHIEPALYPDSYFHDMGFFLTKFMTYTFDKRPFVKEAMKFEIEDVTRFSRQYPNNPYRQPNINLVAPAFLERLVSAFERRLNFIVKRTIHCSGLDESVSIGTAVLLGLLNDLSSPSQQRPFVLPAYPDEAYIRYFMGAFMLSYRLLSQDRAVAPHFWETVFSTAGLVYSAEDLIKLEDDFRGILEHNFESSTSSSEDSQSRMHFTRTSLNSVPSNPFITPYQYMKTKVSMYSHIHVLMSRRGEESVEVTNEGRWMRLDVELQFPPCYLQMMMRMETFEGVRRTVPALLTADYRQVHDYILTAGVFEIEVERVMKMMKNPSQGVGLGLSMPFV